MKTCKNLSKRGLALFLALVMCLSMVQITAFAVDGHVHNEDGWSCTQDDSVRELSCDKHVHNDNCYQTVQGELTCEAEEHQHGDGCYEAAEPQLTCADAEHTHGDSCYTQGEDVLTCAETEHTHGEDCYAAETVKVCEEEDHQHGDECYTVTEGEWTCTAPVVEEAPAEEENNEAPVTYEVRDTGRTSNVTNTGDGTTVEPVIPDYPDAANLQGITVTTKCTYNSNGHIYLNNNCYKVPRTLNGHPDGYVCSDIRENQGELGTSNLLARYPYACTLTLNREYWADYYNQTLASNSINKTHYLNSLQDSSKTTMTLLYNAEKDQWDYDTEELEVYVTETAPITYTVKYVDGKGGLSFDAVSQSGLKAGDATPTWAALSGKASDAVPTCPGYTFMGWAPAVKNIVDPDMADRNGVITYTATWQKDTTPPAPETIKVPVTIKVRFEGLDNGVFTGDCTHPEDFSLIGPTTNPEGAIGGYYAIKGNAHGDGVEPGTEYVPYVTFGPEDDFGAWTVEKGKEYDVHFDLSNYTVDGYTYVSANGVANASSVELKFQADNTNPQELVITLVYKKDIEPTTPDAPTHQDVRDLIGAPVTVVCDTENVSNNTFGYTGDKTDRVTIGKVEGDATSGYTCNVTFIAQKFCDAFSSVRKEAHKLADGQGNVTLTLTWDAENNTWKLPVDFTAPVTIHVVCDNAKNIPYILHYKANPGEEAEVENLPASETKYGTAPGAVDFIVSSQVPTRDGYSFAGWEVENKLLHGGDTFTMTGSAAAVKVEQTLWATWTKNPDPGPGPGVEPNKDGLKLTKAVDNSNPELGGTVTYTITVSNETRVDLKDLKIKDVMPEGVTLVEGSGKVTVNGAARNVSLTQDGQTCSWTVDGVIPVDGKVILTYNATVPGAAAEQITLTNTAQAFANQNEAPAPQMAQGVAQYAASMANDFVSGPASSSATVTIPGYDFTSNEDNATVTVKPGGGTNPGPVKPGKPDDGDLNKLKLGVQVVCDVENSNHSVTEYLLKTAECTIGEVTENADTATKDDYPYTCTVQLAASGQNWYLGQKIKDTQDYWNKEHQLADRERTLTATLYHDGEKWTLPIGDGMNPDVAQGTNIKAWKYLVIHTVHKAEQLPGAKDTTYTVVHEYYTNNSLTGTSQSVENGKVGQTVNAAEITKVTTYGGNSYTYTSANPEILVLADGENTITLRYDRTTGGNGGGNGGGTTRYTLTVRYEYEDGTQAAPTHTERLARGDAYSVDSPVIEGYTPDQAVVSGEMPGRSLTVTVVYTPDGQDIPDEEPPLVDLPDEEPPLVNIPEEEPPLVEIPEEEPPLAETPLDPTPKTGDNSRTGLWAALCGFSLFGMLALLGKKREDEEA